VALGWSDAVTSIVDLETGPDVDGGGVVAMAARGVDAGDGSGGLVGEKLSESLTLLPEIDSGPVRLLKTGVKDHPQWVTLALSPPRGSYDPDPLNRGIEALPMGRTATLMIGTGGRKTYVKRFESAVKTPRSIVDDESSG
jgi:hypothetical protein